MILSSPNPVKFNPSTSYADHYKGFTIDNRVSQPQQPPELDTQFIREPIRFEGVSNYKSNYVPPPKV